MAGGGIWTNLTRGHGPRIVDWFLEPTCRNSARAFGKISPLLERAGEDRITIRVTVHSQPWHLFSGLVSRAVLAAALLPEGRDVAWKVLAAVYDHREDFVATEHCYGPNMEVALADMQRRIDHHSGVDLSGMFVRKEVTDLLKKHTRYARQNGIHVSPSVMVDGLVNDKISSRDEIDAWITELGLLQDNAV